MMSTVREITDFEMFSRLKILVSTLRVNNWETHKQMFYRTYLIYCSTVIVISSDVFFSIILTGEDELLEISSFRNKLLFL